MKTKVISVRVPIEVSDILDSFCLKQGVTKSDVLSELVVNNYNLKNNKDKFTPLERLLMKLRVFIDHSYHEYAKVETPAIIMGTEEDGEYEGQLQILVGDDTMIVEKNGLFASFDLGQIYENPYWLTEEEIVDFYKGQELAYELPKSGYDSYHFLRGFMQVANNLIPSIQEYLDENETPN